MSRSGTWMFGTVFCVGGENLAEMAEIASLKPAWKLSAEADADAASAANAEGMRAFASAEAPEAASESGFELGGNGTRFRIEFAVDGFADVGGRQPFSRKVVGVVCGEIVTIVVSRERIRFEGEWYRSSRADG